jgi:hypothetical protein
MRGIGWRHWRWLDDGVLPLAAAVTYAAWAQPVFALYLRDPLTGAQSGGYTFWLCLTTLLGGTLAGRTATRSYRGPAIVVGGGFAAIGATLFAVFYPWRAQLAAWPWSGGLVRAAIAAAVGALFLWWRGLRMANADHHEETASTFVVGTLALAALALLGQQMAAGRMGTGPWIVALLVTSFCGIVLLLFSLTPRVDRRRLLGGGEAMTVLGIVFLAGSLGLGPARGALSGTVLLYVFAGLVTRSLLGLSWVLNSQRGQGGARLHVEGSWVATMVGVVAVVLGLGLSLGQVLTPDAVRAALRWLSVLWMPVLAVVAFVVFTLVWAVARAVLFVLSRLGLQLPEAPPEPPEEVQGLADWAISLPAPTRWSIGVLGTVVAIALVAWILYRLARRLRAPSGRIADAVEHRRSTFSLAALRARIDGVLGRWRRGGSPFVRLDARTAAQRAIRAAYRRVLRRALARGTPREPGQSPRAYAHRLEGLWPEEEGALASLTGAYEAARYGARTPSAETVRAAKEAAARVGTAPSHRTRRAREGQAGGDDADTGDAPG